MRKQIPPIKAQDLTAIANGQGINGTVLIIDHSYFLDTAGERRRIGFTRTQAEGFILRKAAKMPIKNLELPAEEVEKTLPDQIDLISGPGQSSLI